MDFGRENFGHAFIHALAGDSSALDGLHHAVDGLLGAFGISSTSLPASMRAHRGFGCIVTATPSPCMSMASVTTMPWKFKFLAQHARENFRRNRGRQVLRIERRARLSARS